MVSLRLGRNGLVEFRQRFVLRGQEGVDHRQHEQGEQGADGQTRHYDDADAEALGRARACRIEQRDQPAIMAAVVISMGRRRTLAACITACIRFMPCSSCSSFATSQIRIPCLVIRPTRVMRPTWE